MLSDQLMRGQPAHLQQICTILHSQFCAHVSPSFGCVAVAVWQCTAYMSHFRIVQLSLTTCGLSVVFLSVLVLGLDAL